MRVFFVGASWQGSSARSLREALAIQAGVIISDIASDHFLPRYRGLPLRIVNRLLHSFQQRELERAVRQGVFDFRPDVILIYKGAGIRPGFIKEMKTLGCPLVNVFPDCSPHAYGREIEESIGLYDLVISTKPFHPPLWRSIYGYANRCVCVPHGYDPDVHLWAEPAPGPVYDVALCSTWRREYHRLMRSFVDALAGDHLSVAIAGSGWIEHREELPQHWQYAGPKTGRAYGEFLRSAKIVIAPVTRDVMIRGVTQPGDEDTTRTYELAAAHCFFLHQRTDYVATVFDEENEVPLWNDATELASLVRRWLPDEPARLSMSAKAHARAVPAYSIPQRAVDVLKHIETVITTHGAKDV